MTTKVASHLVAGLNERERREKVNLHTSNPTRLAHSHAREGRDCPL